MEFNATFIVAFFSFIVFIFIMNFILYEPINKITSKRQQLIDDNYEMAKTNSNKSKVILSEREEKLNKAKASSRKTYSEALEDASSTKNSKIQNAKKDSKTTILENKNSLETEKSQAIAPLKTEVINLAQAISDKLLNNHEKIENIDNELIENLIQG